MENKKIQKFSIAWCDNGSVDSRFMEGVISLFQQLEKYNLKIDKFFHSVGSLISIQRQSVSKSFEDSDSDWILFLDSDIYVTPEMIKKLFDHANEKNIPVLSGVYFLMMNPNDSLPVPAPAFFNFSSDNSLIAESIIPHDQLIKIDASGLGMCLIHKSVFLKLKEKYPDSNYFNMDFNGKQIGEDLSFFLKLKELQIPVHVHTGINPQHIKRYPLDNHYFTFWWNNFGSQIYNEGTIDKENLKINFK
jgi:predicted glycosyltransferase involved in capsule biosynthesis